MNIKIYIKIVLLILFYINIVKCKNNDDNAIIDKDYLNYIRSNENDIPILIYYLSNKNILNVKEIINWQSNFFRPIEIITHLPLRNPIILGSFSNNTMFFIGSKYIDNIRYNIYEPIFKPILLISEFNRYHYSITYNDGSDNGNNESFEVYSMTTNKINNEFYFSISVVILNISYTNFNKVVYLNDTLNHPNRKLYTSNIKVNYNSLHLFKFSHDKLKNVYYSLVKESITNNTYFIKFDRNAQQQFNSFKVNTSNIDFQSIVFGGFDDNIKLYGEYIETVNNTNISGSNSDSGSSGSGISNYVSCILKYNLKTNETIIEQQYWTGRKINILSDRNDELSFYLQGRLDSDIISFSISNEKTYDHTNTYYPGLHYYDVASITNIYYVYKKPPVITNNIKFLSIVIIVPALGVLSIIGIVILFYFLVFKRSIQHNHHSQEKQQQIKNDNNSNSNIVKVVDLENINQK